MRILFALPGLHRFERGAEIAFTSLASELALGGDQVTLIGAGQPRNDTPYRFLHAGALRRERFERFPKFPVLRGETSYEEATFVPGLLRRYRPADYDVTVTCSFPFTHWALRRPVTERRPAHVFVTQNGDWPARSNRSEFRFFACDALVCTNPDYYADNRSHWRAALIPNGVAVDRFASGVPDRARFGLPEGVPLVLMVSALIESKRVLDGVRAVAALPGVHLACAGDGPQRAEVEALVAQLMPGRFTRLMIAPAMMPSLYHSADAFLHLSLDEPFGNVFIEAMAAGLPIVAHRSSRTRWIIGDDQFDGDSTSNAALAATISSALASGDTMAAARRAQARRFDWPAVAAQYRQFFGEVVQQRH